MGERGSTLKSAAQNCGVLREDTKKEHRNHHDVVPRRGAHGRAETHGGVRGEAPEGLLHLFRRAMRSKSLLGGVKQCRTSRLKICKSPRKALPELQRGQEDAKRQFRISELAA